MAGALGGCVAAFYYVMTLRVQQANMKSTLETRQAQLLMAVYDKLTEPRLTEMWLNIINTEFKDYSEFKKKFIENPEKFKAFGEMAMIFEARARRLN